MNPLQNFEALKENETFRLSLGVFLDVQIQSEKNLQRTLKASRKLLERIDERLDKIDGKGDVVLP